MVYRTTETGIFTPHTETNDVVVDWVLDTCDTSDMRSISTVLHVFMRSMTFWLPQQIVLPFFKAGFFGYL